MSPSSAADHGEAGANADFSMASQVRMQRGELKVGVDPADVLLLMGCLWRTPDTSAGRSQIRRLLDIVTSGLQS